MSFEADLREFKVQRKARSQRAAKLANEAEAAAPAAAAGLWQAATLELRGVFELTLKLRDSFLTLQAVLDAQPAFFYPELRQKLQKTAILVDDTVGFGVGAVLRMELRRATRTGASAADASVFLSEHVHLLGPQARAEAEAELAAFSRQKADAAEAQANQRRAYWVQARQLAEHGSLDSMEQAAQYARSATAGQAPGAIAASERFVRKIERHPTFRVDLAPEIGAGFGMGLHARVATGRWMVGSGITQGIRDGTPATGLELRLGLDTVGGVPWEWRRTALVPTLSYNTAVGPGVGFEFSRTRRTYRRGFHHVGLVADVLPASGTGRVRIAIGRGGAL